MHGCKSTSWGSCGGPALIGCNLSYFRDLIAACRAEGLKPDFISWDCYGHLPDRIFDDGRAARALHGRSG